MTKKTKIIVSYILILITLVGYLGIKTAYAISNSINDEFSKNLNEVLEKSREEQKIKEIEIVDLPAEAEELIEENIEGEEDTWILAEFSAYNNVEEQCDSTPDITASGLKIKGDEKIVAVNGYEFGTKIEIEGMGIYTVEDRMNRRYGINNIDILFHKDMKGALKFGRQNLKYRVIEE